MLSLNGLTYRNVKENIAREPVYFFTMILIEMLMLAFNSMLFSRMSRKFVRKALSWIF